MMFMQAPRTMGSVSFQPPHRSFWRRELVVRARPLCVQDHLVSQVNLRGFMGAWSASASSATRDPLLCSEEIIVGLCAPHAPQGPSCHIRLVHAGRVTVEELRPDGLGLVQFWRHPGRTVVVF